MLEHDYYGEIRADAPLQIISGFFLLVIKEEDSEIVRRIFQRFIEIHASKLIAGELNAAGLRTRQDASVWFFRRTMR